MIKKNLLAIIAAAALSGYNPELIEQPQERGYEINVYDSKTKKYSKEKIKTIVENNANRHFVRRNIMTKGAVVETAKGKVKITSRPGQVGVLQGILIK